MIFLRRIDTTVKEKYKQLFIYAQFGGIRTMIIHKRSVQGKETVVIEKINEIIL